LGDMPWISRATAMLPDNRYVVKAQTKVKSADKRPSLLSYGERSTRVAAGLQLGLPVRRGFGAPTSGSRAPKPSCKARATVIFATSGKKTDGLQSAHKDCTPNSRPYLLLRAFRTEGHAEGDHRPAQCGRGRGTGRSGRTISFRRPRIRDLPARAADAGGARRDAEGHDREMMAGHQGVGNQSGMRKRLSGRRSSRFASPVVGPWPTPCMRSGASPYWGTPTACEVGCRGDRSSHSAALQPQRQ